LWRLQEGHLLLPYNIQAANCILVVTYDFSTGRYFANRLIGYDAPIQYDIPALVPGDFQPARVLARYGH